MADSKEVEILQTLKDAYPDLDVGPGTPFYEMVVRPMSFLWTQHENGYTELLSANVLENYLKMKPADMDRLVTRYLVERKTGSYVTMTVRIVFDTLRDYYIPASMPLSVGASTSSKKTYTTTTDYYFTASELPGSASLGYYVDVTAISDGVGNSYNAYMNDAVTINDDTIAAYVSKAYVVEDSTDGGVVETNQELYRRVKDNMSLSNLTTYRGVRGMVKNRFNVIDVIPIGLRDAEMRRDLIDVPGAGIIHRGGMSDTYVRVEPFSIVQGYKAPLGFPYMFNGKSVESDPDGLMAEWNAQNFGDVDIFDRGSVKETIFGLTPQTNMYSLTTDVQPIHDFAVNTENEAIHSDNLVKQMWPIVVTGKIRVSSIAATGGTNTSAIVATAKSAFVNYIMGLRGSEYPQIVDVGHALKNAGVSLVHVPMKLECFYISENLDMHKFGLNLERVPATGLLKPVESDSLKFEVDDDTQISIRTCVFYTNTSLINVEVV